MDLIKRREKIKLTLMQTECEIEEEKWRVAREKAREERLASVTALPSSDGKIRLRLNKPAAASTPATTTPSPLPWYKRDEDVDLTTSAAQSAEQLERTIGSLDERVGEMPSDEVGSDGKDEVEVKAAVRKSSRARRSSTMLDSSVVSVITPKRRVSRPNTPATRRNSRGDEAMEEMTLDGPLAVNVPAAEEATASTAVSTRSRPSSPRAKRARLSSSPRVSPAPSALSSPTSDGTAAVSPLLIPATPSVKGKRSYKRKSGQLNESEASEQQPVAATPTPRQSKRHRLSLDTGTETEQVTDQANTQPVAASPLAPSAATAATSASPLASSDSHLERKTRGRKPKAQSPTTKASALNGIHSSPTTPAATPRPVAGSTSTAASPSSAASPSASRFPLANVPPSSDDHQSAPFALNSVAEVSQSGRYYDATICAVQHTRHIALHAKSSNPVAEGSEPPTVPRGADWNVAEVSRRSVVREGGRVVLLRALQRMEQALRRVGGGLTAENETSGRRTATTAAESGHCQ